MSDDLTSALRDAERRMQAAQLAGDADVLDGLLDDRLIYTGGPDGARYSKQDDLEIQRSRTQRLSKVEELIVFDVDMTAVASDDSLDQHARTEQMKAARGPSVHTHRLQQHPLAAQRRTMATAAVSRPGRRVRRPPSRRSVAA